MTMNSLRKMIASFIATKYLYSNEFESLSQEDKEKKYDEALEMRKESFQIMAERYLDLWD